MLRLCFWGEEMFTTVFSNVAMLLMYMILGYILCKSKKAVPSHAKSMSGLLIYILSPAMLINSFLQIDFSYDNLICILKYFIISFILQALFMTMLYILFHKRYEDARFRILSVGGVLGNVGFFGMPVISGLFPDKPIVMCYSSINVMSMNLIVFTMGVFLITNDKKYISVKSALLNPTSLSIGAALVIYFTHVQFPEVIGNGIALMAKMVTPMCMFILGIRLATEELKEVFGKSFVYLTCLFKLILFPLFAFVCVKWLPFMDPVAKTTIVVLAAAPAGAVIESLAEFHECEQELSANVVLLTTILSIVSMPIVLHIFMNMIGF